MDAGLVERVRQVTGARSVGQPTRVQALWRGWGEIVRVPLDGAPWPSVIAKIVRPTDGGEPADVARKRRSYEVEAGFYRTRAGRCADVCRVPRMVHAEPGLLVLEDLDGAGFTGRTRTPSEPELLGMVRWLAAFHATFLGDHGEGLWPMGTYWHLQTRRRELERTAGPLRDAAEALDHALESAAWKTLVHGDAKPANFCVGPRGVGAVDFQYVGRGVGVRDLAYLLGCMPERALQAHVRRWEDVYFEALRARLGPAGAAVETEWRALIPVAWADHERFLAGWAPGHAAPPDSVAGRLTAAAITSTRRPPG